MAPGWPARAPALGALTGRDCGGAPLPWPPRPSSAERLVVGRPVCRAPVALRDAALVVEYIQPGGQRCGCGRRGVMVLYKQWW
eukprot:185783-Chlamydomonas_euryale.AAC.1